MSTNRHSTTLAWLMTLAGACSGAATMEGQVFEGKMQLAERELHLNGLGMRVIFIIKGYVAGLYLEEKAATFKEVTNMPGPKRLQLRMLRGAGPDDFNSALVDGIRKNASKEELLRLNDRIVLLARTITEIGVTVAGDVIDLDYFPGIGTRLAVNGARKGTVIEGADFYIAVLGIFVGDSPVDTKLKKGLLGQ